MGERLVILCNLRLLLSFILTTFIGLLKVYIDDNFDIYKVSIVPYWANTSLL